MEIVELRVHGVHGTSPGTMLGLGDSEVGQVAGDKLTGIYRAKKGVDLPYRALEGTPISVEAYSWGALTSGIQGFFGWVKRALWLLLLPFAMANLAYWARLELARPTAQARWGARAVRVSALLLTVFMVLTPCVIAIDMVAWQCYRRGVPGCVRMPEWLDFLATWTSPQRLAAATLIPMLVVAILWLLSKQSLARYETCGDAIERDFGDTEPVLVHPKLWDGLQRTQRLQRLHVSMAIATVIGFSGAHVLYSADGKDVPLVWVTTVVSGLIALKSMFLVCVSHADDLENMRPRDRWAEQFAVGIGDKIRAWPDKVYARLSVMAVVAYVVHVGALWFTGADLEEGIDFFGHNLWFIAVFVLLTVLHLSVFAGGRMPSKHAVAFVVAPVCVGAITAAVLFDQNKFHGWTLGRAVIVVLVFWAGLTLWHYFVSTKNHHDKAWSGAGASVFLATAAWISLLFTTSVVVATANYLNGPNHSVSDLISSVEKDEGGAEAAIPAPTQELPSATYVAAGDVTLRDAHVTPGDGTTPVVVHSGTIEVGGLSLDEGTKQAFTEGLGEVLVSEDATLRIEGTTVNLADSCLDDGGRKCTGEEEEYHAAGVIQVHDQVLTISPENGDVVLDPGLEPEFPLVVPQVLIWTPMAQLVWLFAVIVGLGLAVRRFTKKAAPELADKTFLHPPAVSDRDLPMALKARTSAALAHRAETVLDLVGAITSPIALVTIVVSMSGQPPWALPNAEWTRHLATASMYLVVGMSAGLVLLGSQIRRSESTRKAVGVIWDLTTFWPRAAHPLAPPCYAERVVPELETRAKWALHKDETNLLILSGHSQGSLIVASMASRLSLRELQRTRIITYGSQIRGMYGRMFPRVFGADAIGYTATDQRTKLGEAFPDVPRDTPATPGPPSTTPVPSDGSLRGRLTRAGGTWVNLVRRTDYLGYRVFSDTDSPVDLPVPEFPDEGTGDPGPAVMTHSGYQHSLVYRSHIALWTGEQVVPDPPGTQNLTVLPPV